LEAGAKIELQPIFFQQSKAIILESSYPELERLAAVMHQNSKLRIRIEGHTDNVGKAEDLMQLSKERADAIRTFLMEKNIEGNRIDVVGHGPKYPLSDNSSDQERAKNRRVEFIITKI
jgi:outer membrane protein OmpA-like peptidoglycan-associated protein